MRKLVVAIAAVPVIAALYARSVIRRSAAVRLGLTIGVGAILGLAGLGLLGADRTTARPTSSIGPIAQSAFSTTLQTGHGLRDALDVEFSRPMDAASVAASLVIEPFAGIDLRWDDSGRRLTVKPSDAWAPDTYYSLTVAATAIDRTGMRLEAPIRAAFLTRRPTTATITATVQTQRGLAPSSAFDIAFDHQVRLADVRAALRTDPVVPGSVEVAGTRPAADAGDGPERLPVTAESFRFQPSAILAAETAYRVWLAPGVVDAEGGLVASSPALTARTAKGPVVVRFRPATGASEVARGSAISVRFSEPMDTAATAAAFSLRVNGAALAGGKTRWAEGRTVLVVQPSSALPYGASVALAVGPTARAATGVPLSQPQAATFTVEPKPAPPKRATATPKPTVHRPTSTVPRPAPIAKPPTSSGSWLAVESYYLRLMNCTRTGGWVTSTGSCSSPGGRNVAPLTLDAGISSKVSRPYAKYLAVHNQCSHFVGGTPGDRLRRAGYTSYKWAENLGCRSGNPYSAVLGSHLFFQSEKSYSGGHYVNLMNALYNRCGIGVWVYGGRVRLVIDFYHS